MVAVGVVIGIVLPIGWVMLRDGGGSVSAGDQSIPYSTLTDDKYPSLPEPSRSPSPTPTPSATPSATPSRTPTSSPSASGSTRTPSGGRSQTADPTGDPGGTHSSGHPSNGTSPSVTTDPTSEPPSSEPADDGNMTARELELFTMINNARVDKGCDKLRRDSDLTGSARSHAQSQADKDTTKLGSGTDAIAGGNGNESTRTAYNTMMDSYGSVLLDCSRDRLGIGYGYYEKCLLWPICRETSRWVADFGWD